MDYFSLNSIRFNTRQCALNDWTIIKVIGQDREQFLNGQLTNDLKKLEIGEAQFTARLNRTGKFNSYFIIAKKSEELFILCEKKLVNIILEDLNKFIIMDEVELIPQDTPVYAVFNHLLDSSLNQPEFSLPFYGIQTGIYFSKQPNVLEQDLRELDEIRILNGYPLWDKDISGSNFINDSYLNEIGISYSKGCFLGQETVAKINNNRGASYYPVILSTKASKNFVDQEIYYEDKKVGKVNYQIGNLLQVNLFRDLRVDGKEFKGLINDLEIDLKVNYLPFFKAKNNQELAIELYHHGVDAFQRGNIEDAMDFLKRSIAFDPLFADAYESIGVILGRRQEYEEGISWMDKLLEVNPSSVMAHTNKSLFLMKLGKIEEAESEKALATVKSFSVFGEEARIKKALEEERLKKEADMNRRESMFYQVLEIDEEDTVALYGIADIAFYRENYKLAVENLEKVVKLDEKYSVAYLLLGKSLEATGNLDRAIQVYKKGIDIASKRGDMMPANEMQSRLNQLIMSSGLA